MTSTDATLPLQRSKNNLLFPSVTLLLYLVTF